MNLRKDHSCAHLLPLSLMMPYYNMHFRIAPAFASLCSHARLVGAGTTCCSGRVQNPVSLPISYSSPLPLFLVCVFSACYSILFEPAVVSHDSRVIVDDQINFKHVAIDVLVRSSMKSATKCVMQCDLYDSVSQEIIERILCSRITPSVCMFQCQLHSTVRVDRY